MANHIVLYNSAIPQNTGNITQEPVLQQTRLYI